MQIAVADLKGVYPAIITPMLANDELDFPHLNQLVEDLIAADVAGICVCRTTGHAPVLTLDEHVRLAVHVRDRIRNRCQMIVSAGSNSTNHAIALSNAIERELGATTFLHVTGYYNNPPQVGLRAHFIAVAEGLIFPESNIILYNVPSRTASNMEAVTSIELASHPRIVGIKESSRDLSQVKDIIEHTDPKGFRVLTGECDQIQKTIAMGGFGVISATANLAPRLLVEMVSAAQRGDIERACELQQRVLPAVRAVFAAKNPIPLAMLFNTHLRLPLVALPDLMPQLKELMVTYTALDLGIDLTAYADMRPQFT